VQQANMTTHFAYKTPAYVGVNPWPRQPTLHLEHLRYLGITQELHCRTTIGQYGRHKHDAWQLGHQL